MTIAVSEPEIEVESLQHLIGWFNQNSLELIREYRRLEERAQHLTRELESQHRELEKSLREREEARAYLLSVLESLNAGVLILGRDLQPTFANRRLNELAGEIDAERAGQLLGKTLAARLRRGDRSFLPLECEKMIQGPDGIVRPLHFVVSEVAAGGSRSDYVVIFQDTTTLKRLEAEAARTRRLASLGLMASELAHQVRNPLGGIELYASLLKENAVEDPRRAAEEILAAARRLHATLSRLLCFAAEPSISPDLLPVPLLMKDLLVECVPLFNDPPWSLAFAIQPGLPPIWGDRGLLVQALLNLVVNAKEAMPAGGRVQLKAEMAPFATMNGRIHRAVEIKVIDEGGGIPPENRERIFDPFFTTKKNGTGLGLALTHKIVHAHHGSIEVLSTPGRGSQFNVCLPAAEETRSDAEANPDC
ncbi:MAG TPA: ATP-binding protein [candidate division Zixibacteria bacterium]|nr:ATP-binding protein [candidate division Zixibacteria bacterium]